MNTEKITQECSQWIDKNGNTRYYLNRWSKHVPTVRLVFSDRVLTGAIYNGSQISLEDFKAIKVWFDKDFILHVRCDHSQELKQEIEDAISKAFDTDYITQTKLTDIPESKTSQMTAILDDMEQHMSDAIVIFNGITKLRMLLK